MKKKGFTLIELLVVIAIIAMLLAILMPALNKVKKIAQRVICGTNLKGLGTAQTVYANDYDDEYVVQGRGYSHTWSTYTADWAVPTKDWAVVGNITVGASLYLLVREADVSPKSFVCPSSEQTEFSGKNSNNFDIVELWDFGRDTAIGGLPAEGPGRCVSYSYQMPYTAGQTGAPAPLSNGMKGKFAADARRSAAFAIMGDKNPYQETKITRTGLNSTNFMGVIGLLGGNATITDFSKIDRWGLLGSNAYPHGREGQNVLYADGHNSWETRSDVGVKNDNIYTHWSSGSMPAGDTLGSYNRRGLSPTDLLTFNPMNGDDTVLVNDGPLTSLTP
jgi:prepilin-type N-terminal cleavage/methylation domain-containing protein